MEIGFCLTFNSKSSSDYANIDAANSTIRLQAHLNPLKKRYLSRLVKFIPEILLCVPLRLDFFFCLCFECTKKFNITRFVVHLHFQIKTTSLCNNLVDDLSAVSMLSQAES